MKSKSFAVVVAAALGVVGCTGSARTEAGQLKAGDRVSVALSADGKSVQSITSDTADGDGETNDDAEGPNGDGDGETNDDAEGPNGDGDGETNDDGTANGTTLHSSSSPAGEVLAQRADIREVSPGSFEAVGMKIQAQALPDSAAVRFVGSVNAEGTFVASSAKGSHAASSALTGTLQAVDRPGNGTVTLQVLGQTVTTSETTRIDQVKSLDDESAKEDDGIECAQEGEHEGDNEGCSAPAPAPAP